MKPIKKMPAVISHINDLSTTAREVEITLPEPIGFTAGCFVNVFIEKNGEKLRRAFSVSSDESEQQKIKVSIRLNPTGAVTPLFWEDGIIGKAIEVMGPLGLNTAEKMNSKKIYLFGFGIGAGVVKSLASHFINKADVTNLTILTGNRSETEILHQDYFDKIKTEHKQVLVEYILSQPDANNIYKTGYIQNHLAEFDFNDSDVYVCGQTAACEALIKTVKEHNPTNCNFFIEDFH